MAETTTVYWTRAYKNKNKNVNYSAVHLTEKGSGKTFCDREIPRSSKNIDVEVVFGVKELPEGARPRTGTKCGRCITRFPESN